MKGLGAITCCPDAGNSCFHPLVNPDRPFLPKGNAGRRGKRRIGAHTEAKDHDVGRQGTLVGHDPRHLPGRSLECGDLLLQVEGYTDIPQCLGYQCPHVLIERPHHLRGPADQGNLQAIPHQGFRHLQADIATTDDDPLFHIPCVEPPANIQAAFEGIYAADADGIGAGKIRTERNRAGGDQKLVIWLPCRSAGFQVADMHLSACRIYLHHFVQNSHINSVLLTEFFRCANNEIFFRVDNPADVVGNPSGRIGGVETPFEDDDVQPWLTPLCLRGGAHPRCISADNDQSFCRHVFHSLFH